MKGDFSQLRFRPRDQYSAVRSQQGRVVLDSDWNEQVDIQQYRERLALRDLIGKSGAPISGGGFDISLSGTAPAQEIRIGAGRMYLGGLLVQNMPADDADYVEFEDQPYLPEAAAPDPQTAGTTYYLVYLDAWERHITVLEDPDLVEPALGGPDTTTRTEVVWQVRMMETTSAATGATTPADYEALVAGSTAKLEVRVASPDGAVEPGLGSTDGGYRGLENQLYRVEIHAGGSEVTWKWSRENASVAARVLDKTGADEGGTQWFLTVSSTGRDPERSFVLDGLVEVGSLYNEARSEAGQLARVVAIDGTVLTVEPLDAAAFDAAGFSGDITVRRWDNDEILDLELDTWVEVEAGIEIRLTGDTFVTGDYWVIPARAETGDVLWPLTSGGAPRAERALGVKHHYAKLAVLKCVTVVAADLATSTWSLKDGCHDLRDVFKPVAPPPPMWVRKAYVKWADGAEKQELEVGDTTLVSIPVPEDPDPPTQWYLEVIVDHVKKNVFNRSNFRVSFPGALGTPIKPAFQLQPAIGTGTTEVPQYPDDGNPDLEGDSLWYTLVVKWYPNDEADAEFDWIASRLAAGTPTPLHLDLHYSADGIVQSAAKFAFVLVQA